MFERAGAPLTTAEVAAFLERLPSLDVSVARSESIDQIGLLESVKGACAAAQARATVAFDVSQRAAAEARGVPAAECGRGVGAQVALARRESPHRGSRHLGLAKALVAEMPHAMAHLTAGRVSEWRVTILARETACLSAQDRGEVDRRLADDLPVLADRQVQARARALAATLDNAAMARRAARAERERRVSGRPAPDTMSYVTALLPAAQGVAVLAALEKAASTAAAKGDERGRGQVMADTLVERVTGQARAEAVPLEVQLVMPAEALFGDGDEPATLGAQVLPAAFARRVLERCAAGGASVWLRRLFTTPDGADLLALESTRRRFEGLLRQFVMVRDQVCRTPWCDAPVRHVDHVARAAAGGATDAANGQGLCEACNYLKETLGWHAEVRHPGPTRRGAGGRSGAGMDGRFGAEGDPGPPHTVRLTTPTGHCYDSTAPPILPARARTPTVDISDVERHLALILETA